MCNVFARKIKIDINDTLKLRTESGLTPKVLRTPAHFPDTCSYKAAGPDT